MYKSRFSNLPPQNDKFMFCMICLTKHTERYNNYLKQKKIYPKLALFDAVTPLTEDFKKNREKINFKCVLNKCSGRQALWISNISVFNYFLQSKHEYIVIIQDDAIIPKNIKNILEKKHIVHNEFIKLGGTRLGQYASCNLYNKHCVKNILDTIQKYPIDRGLDHYISNINSHLPGRQQLPFLFNTKLSCIPLLTKVNPKISNNSMRIYYDKKIK